MKQLGGGVGESSYEVVFKAGEEELELRYLMDEFPPLWRQTEDE